MGFGGGTRILRSGRSTLAEICANLQRQRRCPEASEPRGAPIRSHSAFVCPAGAFGCIQPDLRSSGRPPSWKVSPPFGLPAKLLASVPAQPGVFGNFFVCLGEKQKAPMFPKNPTVGLNPIPPIIRMNASHKRFPFNPGILASLLPPLSVKTAAF